MNLGDGLVEKVDSEGVNSSGGRDSIEAGEGVGRWDEDGDQKLIHILYHFCRQSLHYPDNINRFHFTFDPAVGYSLSPQSYQ